MKRLETPFACDSLICFTSLHYLEFHDKHDGVGAERDELSCTILSNLIKCVFSYTSRVRLHKLAEFN